MDIDSIMTGESWGYGFGGAHHLIDEVFSPVWVQSSGVMTVGQNPHLRVSCFCIVLL